MENMIDDSSVPTFVYSSKMISSDLNISRDPISPVILTTFDDTHVLQNIHLSKEYSSSRIISNLNVDSRNRIPLIIGLKQGVIQSVLKYFRFKDDKRPILNNNEDEEEDLEENFETSVEKAEEKEIILQSRKCSTGIFLASLSCIFFATSSLIVKISPLFPMQLLAIRGLLQLIFVIPVIISSGSSFLGPPGSRVLLLTRAILGSVSLIMAFNAIHLIPLADASTVIFTSPVFVSLFACIFLGELCNWFDASMISLTILGLILVSKPSFTIFETSTTELVPEKSNSWENLIGIFCGLLASMLTALAFIVLRRLKHVHYSVIVFWFSSVLVIFGALLTFALDRFTLPETWLTWTQCIGIGICGFCGQILLTKALQIENAGPVAVARSLDIVLSFIYEIIFLNETPNLYSYCGSSIVVVCVILTAFRKWITEKQSSLSTISR